MRARMCLTVGLCAAVCLNTGQCRAQAIAVHRGLSSLRWVDDTTLEAVDSRSTLRWRWKLPADKDTPLKRAVSQERNLPPTRNPWLATSPDGQWTARGTPWEDRVWVTQGRATTKLVDLSVATVACWSRDSRSLWIATDNPLDAARRVWRWNITDRQAKLAFEAPGTSNVSGMASFTRSGKPDGELLAITHLVPKSRLPSTQIEQGWVFTNALTLVDFENEQPRGRLVPLDTRTRGYANPSGVAASPDGQWLYVAHDGTEVVSVVDVARVMAEVVSQPFTHPESQAGQYDAPDLTRTRRLVPKRWTIPSPASELAVSPDGARLAVAHSREDKVSILETMTGRVARVLDLAGDEVRNEDEPQRLVRMGEALFHSGRLSFGGQFSCASCHPRGHTDGLSWDLPADGFNNFQNTKSLLDAAGTSPYGWHGGSGTLRERFTGTLRGLFQYAPTDEESLALEAYLESLRAPAREPHAPTHGWTRGRELFGTAGCANCHAGPRFTDGKRHSLKLSPEEPDSTPMDTPSLTGVARSGPWLHDGRARSLASIFGEHDPDGTHGGGKDLDPEDLRALLEYLSSL